jgi:hypothetical protein
MVAVVVAVIAIWLIDVLGASPSPASQISHSYYYESHGRDDLREWRSAILKGAQYLKIDLNFQSDPGTCKAQRRIPRTHNFSNGCFVLVHSFAAVDFWGEAQLEYNSSYDIAQWLLDDRNFDVATLRPLVFQMCLKNAPADKCDGSWRSTQWIALVDEFFALVQPILSSPRIRNNVQFVFDQLNRDDQCVLNRWRPWNSTWVGQRGTGEDNNLGGNISFQMVNMATTQVSSWSELGETHMGKFFDGDYAMVAWEPVDEVDCNGFFEYFRTFQYANPRGTLLAFNADPSLFHVFTANQTERYSHFAFGDPQSLTGVMWYASRERLLITASFGGEEHGGALQVSLHTRGSRGTFRLMGNAHVTLKNNTARGILGGRITAVQGISRGENNYTVFVAGNSLCVVKISIAFYADNFTIDSSQPPICLRTPNNADTVSDRAFALANVSASLAIACAEVLHNRTLVWSLIADAEHSQDLVSHLLVAKGVNADEGVSTALMVFRNGGELKYTSVTSWSHHRQVFASAVYNGTFGRPAPPPTPSPESPPVQVGVGRDPFVSFANTEDTQKILMSYGFSFCYNDLLVDDDAFTMTGVKICDLRDKAYTNLFGNWSNPINSYLFGDVREFVNELEKWGRPNASQHRNGFATTCSERLFHGVFDVGYNASVLLLPREEGDVDIVHGGYLGVAALTSLTWPLVSITFCGNPVPHDGQLMLDSFPLFGFYNESAL